jgi:hypothetical protein
MVCTAYTFNRKGGMKISKKNTCSRRRETSLAAVGCGGGKKQQDGLVPRSSMLDWWPAAPAQGRGVMVMKMPAASPVTTQAAATEAD